MAIHNGTALASGRTPPTQPQNAADTPFRGLGKELSSLLKVHAVPVTGKAPRKLLLADDSNKPYLPGQPRIRLPTGAPAATAVQTQQELQMYLERSHLTTELDEILPYMKYIFVQTPSHRHIMPLHHQKAHGRDVVVNEHPGLHLLWYYDRIFIKPIPAYFFTSAFWDVTEQEQRNVHKAAVGFLRSYYYLIQYEIDFDLACEKKLVPKKPDGNHPSYEEFCDFIANFRDAGDTHVSRRFHYGELRLSRLNKTAMLFRGHLAYFHIHPQWGSYLSHVLAPIITVFVVISVVLNSMQVTLQAVAGPDGVAHHWHAFVSVAAYFPVVVICLIAVVISAAIGGIVIMGVKDLVWSKRVRHRKAQGDVTAGEKSHGMVW
ncbi:hypothetical protein NKR19_g2624 [Coniochaeta hoffmannii]|uniref:Subtilisin-like serine protease n=1 Tax=Coniochaeta hoffmannii TaxID=91930 RepID=A0AA38RYF7_9PEZI|nr:hypothetical protein NKR19_g2624 [Coniochaeta hoffmannii]